MVQIEKNIPFPPPTAGRRSEYPWYELKVGDSFAYNGSVVNAQAAATYYTGKTNKTFRARAHNGGTRVWRVK